MARPVKTFVPQPEMRGYYDRRFEIWTRLNRAIEAVRLSLAEGACAD